MGKDAQQPLVPKLRFPEFRDAKGWDVKKLGDEGDFLSSLTGKTAQHFGTGSAKYIPYMNVFTNTFADMSSLGHVKIDEGERQNCVESGDVLFTVSSETPQDVGMSSVVLQTVPDCYLNSFCALFRYASGKQPNLRFLGYSLRQPLSRDHFARKAQGSTRFNLSKAVFRSLPVAIPSLAEQQKIAECLTSLDELIAAQARKVELLKYHKKGLMQRLFPREGERVPRLRFAGFAGKWEERRVGDIFHVTRGNVLSMRLVTARPTDKAPYPVYSSQTKGRGLAGYYSEYLFEDAITWTTDGANAGDVNYRAGKFYCTNVCGVLISDHGLANPCVAEVINSVSRKHVSYVGNPKLMNGVMAKIEIRVPSLQEQQRIADCLSAMDDQIAAEAEKLDALHTHKRGLMQQLFPGAG